MSTKITLWSNDDYHLYREGFDDENVYLRIRSESFAELTLKLPLDIWKELRKYTIEPEETYLDLTDEELREVAGTEVDSHRKWLAENPDSFFVGLYGALAFGRPESSRPEMIEHFMEYYRPQSNAQS